MKGILKKALIYLKLSLIALPAVVLGGSIYGIVKGVQMGNEAKNLLEEKKLELLDTPEVLAFKEKDINYYAQQFETGVISPNEYAEKINYIESIEYLDHIVSLPEFDEQQAILKEAEKVYKKQDSLGTWIVSGCSLLGLTTGGTFSLAFYLTPDGRDFIKDFIEFNVDDLKQLSKKKKDKDRLEIEI